MNNELSDFVANMRPIGKLGNFSTDMRWHNEIVKD
jgi:hypothetical protein